MAFSRREKFLVVIIVMLCFMLCNSFANMEEEGEEVEPIKEIVVDIEDAIPFTPFELAKNELRSYLKRTELGVAVLDTTLIVGYIITSVTDVPQDDIRALGFEDLDLFVTFKILRGIELSNYSILISKDRSQKTPKYEIEKTEEWGKTSLKPGLTNLELLREYPGDKELFDAYFSLLDEVIDKVRNKPEASTYKIWSVLIRKHHGRILDESPDVFTTYKRIRQLK